MPVPSSAASQNEDLSVNDLLLLLFDRKWLLLGATLIVGFLAAVVSLLLPNQYLSSAALIIRQPEIPIIGEASPLTPEMLAALANSIQIKRSAYDSLQDTFQEYRGTGALKEDLSFRAFLRMLDLSLDRQKNLEAQLIPLIQLNVTSPSPELSARIANEWAAKVTSQTHSMYAGGIDNLGDFIDGVFAEADRVLVANESNYTSTMLQVNLDLDKVRLMEMRKQHAAVYAEALVLEEKTSATFSMINQKRLYLSEQEVEHIWLGELLDNTEKAAEIKKLVEASPTAFQVMRIYRNINQNQKALAEFEHTNNLSFIELELGQKERELGDILAQLMDARSNLARMEATYFQMKSQLEGESAIITLNKAITDDVLWTELLRNIPTKDLKTPILKSEESNPVYQELKSRFYELEASISGQMERVRNFEDQLVKLRERAASLKRDETLLAARKEALVEAIEKDRELHLHLKEAYNAARKTLETLREEYESNLAALKSKRGTLDQIQREIGTVEARLYPNQDRITALQRAVENSKKAQQSVASQKDQVALLRISAKQASRSGAMTLYDAVGNPMKASPRRSRIVLASMMAAFFLLTISVVTFEIVRRARGSQKAAA
jgi:uncharacterized protein involved in exopolysaccharide biosynthesis